MKLLPAGQRPMEIVGSIDLTHHRSNGGRESVERLSSGVDSGYLLQSRQLDVDRRVHRRVIKAADRQDAAAPVDCKTVRIFVYSSTREQSNKRCGTRLKTESEVGERR